MSAATLERDKSSDATEAGSYSEADEQLKFMAHVVGKSGLLEDAYIGRLSGRKPNPRLRSAAPPEGKPKPSDEDVDQFLEKVEAELLANAEVMNDISLVVAAQTGQLAVGNEAELTLTI
jgi:hypothetical protein